MLNIKELGGARLRKALKAENVRMGFHNKNKSGGNFGITILIPHPPGEPDRVDAGAGMTKENQRCYELWGFHDLEGNIYRLTFGGCSSGGKSDITSRAPNLNSLLQLMFKAIYPNEGIPMSLQTPPEEPLVSYESKSKKGHVPGKPALASKPGGGTVEFTLQPGEDYHKRCKDFGLLPYEETPETPEEPLVSYETGNNPWVEIVGGDTTFGRIDIGETFHFPNTDVDYVKASKSTYKGIKGGRFHTGTGTAVISGKHKAITPEEPLISYSSEDKEKKNAETWDKMSRSERLVFMKYWPVPKRHISYYSKKNYSELPDNIRLSLKSADIIECPCCGTPLEVDYGGVDWFQSEYRGEGDYHCDGMNEQECQGCGCVIQNDFHGYAGHDEHPDEYQVDQSEYNADKSIKGVENIESAIIEVWERAKADKGKEHALRIDLGGERYKDRQTGNLEIDGNVDADHLGTALVQLRKAVGPEDIAKREAAIDKFAEELGWKTRWLGKWHKFSANTTMGEPVADSHKMRVKHRHMNHSKNTKFMIAGATVGLIFAATIMWFFVPKKQA